LTKNIPGNTIATLKKTQSLDEVPLALERPTLHDFRTGQKINFVLQQKRPNFSFQPNCNTAEAEDLLL
jgi:hypothetical protein